MGGLAVPGPPLFESTTKTAPGFYNMNAFRYRRPKPSRRWVYPLLMALCIAGFWWFENVYTPDPYSGDGSGGVTPFPQEYVPEAPELIPVQHDHYELGYNEAHEQAAWVAYTLHPEHLTRDDRVRPYFVEDPRVPTKSADWRNYKRSGYDRGHLCPAGDRRFSETAYNQTFYTSNISPQDPEFNAGAWNTLELQVRAWCKRYGTLYVITGGVLQEGLPAIGDEGVSVPGYFFKVVFRGSGGQLRAAGFLMPNQPLQGPLEPYRVSLDRIEALTGLDFFTGMGPANQATLESGVDRQSWPLRP